MYSYPSLFSRRDPHQGDRKYTAREFNVLETSNYTYPDVKITLPQLRGDKWDKLWDRVVAFKASNAQ